MPPLSAVGISGLRAGDDVKIVRVALDHPLPTLFDYRCAQAVVPGTLVAVPFGRRRAVGLVWETAAQSGVPAHRLRDVEAICTLCTPLSDSWRALIAFAAQYYQRGVGEVALPALPQALRDASRWPRLFAVEPVYRLSPLGRAALPDALGPRAAAQRLLAVRLAAAGALTAAQARLIHPRARVILHSWRQAGWIVPESVDESLDESRARGAPTRAAPTEPPFTAASLAAGTSMDSSSVDRSSPGRSSPPASPPASPSVLSPGPSLLSGTLPKRSFVPESSSAQASAPARVLTEEQRAALAAVTAGRGFHAFLLHGVTGSGKTEVYLQALAVLLRHDPTAQALVLVPEINLTPQFEAAFRARFAELPASAIQTLHSGLADGERMRHWHAAHTGRARIVLGTRLAVLASLPRLALIVVDEEHESAYKQQEGLRYSARDLAVWRAKQLDIPVVLGSATPSLESWWHAEQGRYTRLRLTRRAVAEAVLPRVRMIDADAERKRGAAFVEGLAVPLVAALRVRLERGEQSLIFLNRRGYAPVLACDACGWIAGCPRCSAYVVLHKPERLMRCHHCGWEARIPRACPDCGNLDLAPLGRGTQRVEEALARVLPSARILRIDADSTRRKGSAEALFADVHAGKVDVLIGTHMVAKGHDFKTVTLVGVLNADAALFSHDFRAAERLFAQLVQVSGRAGRAGHSSEVLIQTRYPRDPLYQALARQDYDGFASATLAQRRAAHLPPFVHQALLRAEARTLEQALAFLGSAAEALDALPGAEHVTRYDPVPLTVVKVANLHRAQLLVESGSRAALQHALRLWQAALRPLKGVRRWVLEVDPLDI